MNKLPNGWSAAHLRDVCELINGRAYKQNELLESGKYPVLRVGNFFTNKNWYFSNLELDEDKYCNSGDLLYAWSASFGPRIWEGEKSIFHYHIWNTRCVEAAIDRKFLYYWFDWDKKNIQADHGTGSTMIHVTKGDMEARSLSLPPLPEQRRIVAKIERVSTKSRRARDHLNHVSKLVEHYRSAVIDAAFRGYLTRDWRAKHQYDVDISTVEQKRNQAWHSLRTDGTVRGTYSSPSKIEWTPAIPLPTSWAWVSIDQVTSLTQYGTSAKTSEGNRGVPVLRMGNIQSGKIDWSNLKYLPDFHQEFPTLLLQPGDILFNRTNSVDLVGKTAVFDGKIDQCSFASYLIRLKCVGVLPEILSFYINSSFGRAWVASVVSQQVGQANVNGTKLKSFGFPLMPDAEQSELSRRISAALEWIDRLAAEATSARKLIERLDQAVLSKAFRGELVPQAPEDEPADVLLARIRAESAGMLQSRRGRGRPRAASV